MLRSVLKLFSIVLVILLSFSLIAQQGEEQTTTTTSGQEETPEGMDEAQLNPETQYSTADRPEDNYLARFHALDKIYKLEKENLDLIFTLNVIKENFKGEESEWEQQYEDVFDGYKTAMDYYYRRKIIYAAVKLEENKKHINELYKLISDKYREDALTMLNLCADNILQLSLQASTASNPNSNKKLFNQITRLRVAYGQMDDAEEARVKRLYNTSVQHYRVAKAYAIAILEDINPEEYMGQYQVHKADNLNRIYDNQETTASEVVDRQEDIRTENERNQQPESY